MTVDDIVRLILSPGTKRARLLGQQFIVHGRAKTSVS